MVRSFLTFSMTGLLVVACGGTPGSTESTGSSGEAVTASAVHHEPSTAPTPIAACEGPLPDVCERCSDGSTECAHWVREGGTCEIQICPSPTVCPEGKKACQVEGSNGTCKDVCVPDTALCVAPPVCAVAPPPPVCPPGEHTCQLGGPNGECEDLCVPAAAICAAPPPSCKPVCDPAGPAPEPACSWSTTSCEWECPICDPPGPAPEQGCTWDTKACDWICAVTGGSGSGSAGPGATAG